jgi:ribonuclease R
VDFTREDVLAALKAAGTKGLKTKDLVKRLGVRSKDVKALRAFVRDLEARGEIIRGRRQRYGLPGDSGYVTGKIVGYGTRAATLVPLDGSPGITVPGESLFGAAHGDVVLAKLVRGRDGSREAQVVRVLDEGATDVIGRVVGGVDGRLGGGFAGAVDLGERRGKKRVAVPSTTAKPGDHVVVRVDQWGEGYEKARGRVSEVLGGPLTPGEDFARIAREFNLPLGFPRPVLEEADAIPDAVPQEELRRRRDLSGLVTFTIDPEDAKDFDDAISIETPAEGHLRVGVHIADVSHYVRPGTQLDYEALARGRSVYLVDRVVPMLPPKLSSNLASLRPDEPRLTLSVFMDVSRHGEVTSYSIKETSIRSAARLNYDEAQAYVDNGAELGAAAGRRAVVDALKVADQLRAVLRAKRIKRGAIELDTPEMDIEVDDAGNTANVKPVRRLDSHNLIEELMILANETVASHMAYLGRLFIYRVHEVPDEEDMKNLSLFAAIFGYRFKWTRGTSPAALEALLSRVKGRPEQYIISMFLLRSLKKAVYSERNVGHFGLASKCYTHFTSPIRRYPDLLVHRLVKTYGLKRLFPEDDDTLGKYVRQACEISTVREIEGDEAERAFIKVKVAEYMEKRIGEEYWGVVSGVKDFGLFIMLEDNLVEGLAHVSCLGDDYYNLDSTGTMLVGSRGKTYYRMGDRVKVKVTRADRTMRQVDFLVIAKEKKEGESATEVETMSRSRLRKIYGELRQEVVRGRSAGRRRGGLARPRGQRGRRGASAARSVKPARLRGMRRRKGR